MRGTGYYTKNLPQFEHDLRAYKLHKQRIENLKKRGSKYHIGMAKKELLSVSTSPNNISDYQNRSSLKHRDLSVRNKTKPLEDSGSKPPPPQHSNLQN
jgi:hypothetical protein